MYRGAGGASTFLQVLPLDFVAVVLCAISCFKAWQFLGGFVVILWPYSEGVGRGGFPEIECFYRKR